MTIAPLPVCKPEDVGLSGAALGRLSSVLKDRVASGHLPGAVALVARHGKVASFEAYGKQDPASGAPMTTDSIFRIYSMTKPIVSVGVMMLWEEGRLLLNDPIEKYLPAMANPKVGIVEGETMRQAPANRSITVQDLLRHTSGLTYEFRGATPVHKAYIDAKVARLKQTNEEQVATLGSLPLLHQPGTKWAYSRSTDVLGRLVEVISGKTLGKFFEERIFTRLAMKDSGFFVAKDKLGRVAQPFAIDPATGEKISLIDVTTQPKYESGGGGGVSTTEDYLRFAQMLLDGGHLGPARLLSRTTVAFMASDHLGPISGTMHRPGYTFGLGFQVRKDVGLDGQSGSIGEYGWAGAGGTYFWIDPKEQLIAILMTQAPGPSRTYYRQLFKELVQQALVD